MSEQKVVNGGGNHPEHYKEIHHHYAEECSQDDIGTFLFTSESVGEGHPGKSITELDLFPMSSIGVVTWFCLCSRSWKITDI
jgi:hypothetical protein